MLGKVKLPAKSGKPIVQSSAPYAKIKILAVLQNKTAKLAILVLRVTKTLDVRVFSN